MMRPVGAHAPTAGGLATAALPYVDAAGAEAVQVFVGNPRGWALSAGDPVEDERFAAGCAQRGIPAFVHATLLVNLGSPTPATVERSAAALAHALERLLGRARRDDARQLLRERDGELGSEGMVTGSLQVPPSGLPIIFLTDHPTTGGYPVVAVLTAAACDVLAQLRAGTTVRFRHAGPR